MTCNSFRNCALVASIAVLIAGLAGGQARVAAKPTETPAGETYTLTARVRILLFWISRPGVGGARISCREHVDGTRQIELLIGSDPERAPMRINRWGYIRESLSGSSLELLGVMTESEEESVDQARARVTQTGTQHAFKAIRGRVCNQQAQATVIHMLLAEDYTYRDLDRLLTRLPATGSAKPTRELAPGVDPGFLIAVKSVIHEHVQQFLLSGKIKDREKDKRLFVFNGDLYRLTAESSRFHPTVSVNGKPYRATIETRFQTLKLSSGSTSKFTITYGTADDIREVPIRIVYRPRWWFEAELQLMEPGVLAGSQEIPSWKRGLN